jgi:serine/threonine protein kinase
VNEWQMSSFVGKHPNIVEYDEVLLHIDEDDKIRNLIRTGFEQGKLAGKTPREVFPDKFLFFTEEYLNRGTVQDWLNQDMLFPGGMLVVLRSVAAALAHLHQRGVSHNDVKPENIFLHQDETGDPRSEVYVKLGDFGLAKRSDDHSTDFWQYGMSTVCMITGEQYGSRKYRKEESETFVVDVASTVVDFVGRGRLSSVLAAIPATLRQIFAGGISMAELAALPSWSSWSFFDGESEPSLESSMTSSERRGLLQDGTVNPELVSSMNAATLKRALSAVTIN